MDMDEILASVENRVAETPNAETEVADTANSEAVEAPKAEAAESTTSVESVEPEKKDDTKVSEVAEDKNVKQDSEPAKRENRKAYHRSTSNDLSRAQYSAQKWQKKYKRLREQLENQTAEFNRYKDLNVADFKDEAEKQDYLAWRASKQQRMEDLRADMEEAKNAYIEESQEREAEIFDNKVRNIYGSNADKFMELEDEWGDTFNTACDTYDKGDVIRDFVRNSPLGPAIKNVIYGDAELQEELFTRTSGNAMIDASDRLNLLRNVERYVADFMRTRANGDVASPAPTPVATVQEKSKPRVLPHLPPRKDVNPVKETKQPQVTGSLTRTEVGGTNDTTTEVGNLYKELFG